MSRGPDVTTMLGRRLRIAAEAAGIEITVVRSDSTPWASATFAGARHFLTLASDDAGFDAWLAALREVDLPMRGHLVADVVVTARNGREAAVNVLTVEER